jgi:hypothetical protein
VEKKNPAERGASKPGLGHAGAGGRRYVTAAGRGGPESVMSGYVTGHYRQSPASGVSPPRQRVPKPVSRQAQLLSRCLSLAETRGLILWPLKPEKLRGCPPVYHRKNLGEWPEKVPPPECAGGVASDAAISLLFRSVLKPRNATITGAN